MAAKGEIYRCNICGNIVEVLHGGEGDLVCCGKNMELLIEKVEDVGKEKHVPVVEKTAKGVLVKIGSVPHPMEETHYIEWIEIITAKGNCRKFLKPGGKPEAEFEITLEEIIKVREYCNVHGLWKLEI
jgi:superoxide reductase